MDENRKKALAQALGQIEKQFGKGSVMRLGDGSAASIGIVPLPQKGSTSGRSGFQKLSRIMAAASVSLSGATSWRAQPACAG